MEYEECDDRENQITYNFLATFSLAASAIATAPGWYSAHPALLSILALSYWPFIVLGLVLTIHSIGRNITRGLTGVLFPIMIGALPWFACLMLTNIIVVSLGLR